MSGFLSSGYVFGGDFLDELGKSGGLLSALRSTTGERRKQVRPPGLCACGNKMDRRSRSCIPGRVRARAEGSSEKREIYRASNRNLQKTHCKNGHEFTDENCYYFNDGKTVKRICKACRRQRDRQKTHPIA